MIKQYPPSEIIKAENNMYILSFNEFDSLSYTDNAADGHAVGLIIESHCKIKNIDITSVEVDPEADSFFAYCNDYEKIKSIALCIRNLVEHTETLNEAINHLGIIKETEGDLTTKEFLEILREDSLEPYIFKFNIDFNDLKQAKNACEEIKELGYKCLFEEVDGEIYFDVQISILPEETDVLEKEQEIKKLAKKHNGLYSDFSVVLFNSPI